MKCIKQVWKGYHYYPCSRKAVVGEYCKQHDPVAKAVRDKEKQDRSNAVWAARQDNHAKTIEAIRLVEKLGYSWEKGRWA